MSITLSFISLALLFYTPSIFVKAQFAEEAYWVENFDFLDHCKWKHELSMSGGGNGQFEWYVNNRSNTFIKTEEDEEGNEVTGLWIKPTFTADVLGIHAVMGTDCPLSECDPARDYSKRPYTLDIWGGAESDQCTSNAFWGCGPRYTKNDGEYDVWNPRQILPPIRSGRVSTSDSFSFRYGKVEVRAKLPKGDWLWPAIWMMPEKIKYGTWPVSVKTNVSIISAILMSDNYDFTQGEIDIMESRGNRKLIKKEDGKDDIDIGVNQVGSALHWGPFFETNQFMKTHNTKNLDDDALFSDDYHVFTLEWTPDGLKFYLDHDDEDPYLHVETNGEDNGRPYEGYWDFSGLEWANGHNADDGLSGLTNPWNATYDTDIGPDAPFDHEFFLVLNVAIGGTGVGGGYWPKESWSEPFEGWAEYKQPWGSADDDEYAKDFDSPMRVFWEAKDKWLPTWQKDKATDDDPPEDQPWYIGDHTAMKIDYIKVYKYEE